MGDSIVDLLSSFFFFKQKTAYEMRISDWSSDVCSSDLSALGCGLTGSCSSTFQRYSLGDHLGVTASPQFPLPAGYVTLPVDSRPPPLGLMPPHSRGQGIRSIPPFSFAFQHTPPGPSGTRRTVGKIDYPQGVEIGRAHV